MWGACGSAPTRWPDEKNTGRKPSPDGMCCPGKPEAVGNEEAHRESQPADHVATS
jgi:hypothetical protein